MFHILRPLVVGIVHGLAGSAAVALLVLTTISRPSWAIGYLLIFGLGTVAGMMLITAAIALPFAYSLQHFVQLESRPRGGLRICERRVWIISLLPDRFRRRIVYRPSELDSEVGQASACLLFRPPRRKNRQAGSLSYFFALGAQFDRLAMRGVPVRVGPGFFARRREPPDRSSLWP